MAKLFVKSEVSSGIPRNNTNTTDIDLRIGYSELFYCNRSFQQIEPFRVIDIDGKLFMLDYDVRVVQ